MKKRIFTIFLAIVLAITNMTVCYADGYSYSGIADINLNNQSNPYAWEEMDGDNPELSDQLESGEAGTGIIQLIIKIIFFILNSPTLIITGIITTTLPSMDSIIFMKGEWGQLLRLAFFEPTDPPKNFLKQAATELVGASSSNIASLLGSSVSAIYQIFRYVALICFVVAIACIAVKMIMSSVGKQKAQYKESLKNWLLGLILLVVGHWIMIYMIYFSDWLVSFIKTILEGIYPSIFGFSLTSAFTSAIFQTGEDIIAGILNVVVNLIAAIVFIAMNLKVFKIYLERVIIVAVLIMLFPIVVIFYVFEKAGLKRGATLNSWIHTFVSQVFIQPIHALSLGMIIIFLGVAQSIEVGVGGSLRLFSLPIFGPIIILFIINFVFKIEDVVKRVLSINGASMGQPMQPMRQVADLAKKGVNTGISAYKIGHHVRSGKNPLERRGIFKDEMIEQMKGWGKRNGVNVAQLYDMNLNEAKNVDDKMANYLKTGAKISDSDIPEITRRLDKNGQKHELMAKFGMTADQWNKAIKGKLGDNPEQMKENELKARMVLAESLKPGSASKYVDKKGNIKKGFKGVFEIEMQGSNAINGGVKKLSKRDFDEHNINALKASLLQDPAKLDAIRNLGLADVNEDTTDDEIIAKFDPQFGGFEPSIMSAIAYSESANVPLEDIIKVNNNGETYVVQSKVNPIKAKRRNQIAENIISNGCKGTFEEQQALLSYADEDKDYINGIIDAEPGIDRTTATAWMNCDPSVTLNDSQKQAMRRVFVRIQADEMAAQGNNGGNANAGGSANAGGNVGRTVSTKSINGTWMNEVEVEVDSTKGHTTKFVQPELGASIEDFAQEAFNYAQTNGDMSIRFGNWGGNTSSFNSPTEIVNAYNDSIKEALVTDFAFGKDITSLEVDRIVEQLHPDFISNHFGGITPEELATQMKDDNTKGKIQEELRSKILTLNDWRKK